MAALNKVGLSHLHGLAGSNKEVRQCVANMTQELKDNATKAQQNYAPNTPSPILKPDGETYFQPVTRVQDIDPAALENANDNTREKYNGYIKQILKEDWQKQGYEAELKDLENVDMAHLMEKGVDETFEAMEEEERLVQDIEEAIEAEQQDPDIEDDFDRYDDPEIAEAFDEFRREDLGIEQDPPEPEPTKIQQDITDQFMDTEKDLFDEFRQEDMNIDEPDTPDIDLTYDDD